MSTQPQIPQSLRFGPFEFDSAAAELRKHGLRVKLRGQPMQILSLLLERPGEIVTRDELQRRLWQGAAFGDFEHGLNAAVNKLRQTLGETAEHSRYIETVPGRGYRFAGIVGTAERNVLRMAPPAEIPRKRTRPGLWVAAGLVTVLAAGYWLGSRAGPASEPAVRISIAAPPGFAMEPASSRQTFELSPDGTRLAFLAVDSTGASRTWIRDLAQTESFEVSRSAGSYIVYWGPDSRSLFLAVGAKLRRFTVGSQSYQDLGPLPPHVFGGTWWNENDSMISSYNRTYRVPVTESSAPRPMQSVFQWAQPMPDGKHLLFIDFHQDSSNYVGKIGTLDRPDAAVAVAETGTKIRYTASRRDPDKGYLVYIRGGNLLAHPFDPRTRKTTAPPIPIAPKVYAFATGNGDFSVSSSGTIAFMETVSRSQLAWVDRSGKQLGSLGPADAITKWARISPDGNKVAVSFYNGDRGNDIWVFDTATGFGRKILAGNLNSDGPIWSADSKRIVYYYGHRSLPQPAIRGIEAGDEETRFTSDVFQQPTDWSRDGRYIALNNTGFAPFVADVRGDLWLIDLQNGNRRLPLTETPFHEANAAFSPDSKWLAFTSNESGRTELFVQAFVAGEKPRLVGERFPVSSSGAVQLRWRADGNELFYLAGDGWIHAVSVRWGTQRPVFGKPEKLFQISLEARNASHTLLGFDVSADGQRFIVPTVVSKQDPTITVVRNWESEFLP